MKKEKPTPAISQPEHSRETGTRSVLCWWAWRRGHRRVCRALAVANCGVAWANRGQASQTRNWSTVWRCYAPSLVISIDRYGTVPRLYNTTPIALQCLTPPVTCTRDEHTTAMHGDRSEPWGFSIGWWSWVKGRHRDFVNLCLLLLWRILGIWVSALHRDLWRWPCCRFWVILCLLCNIR